MDNYTARQIGRNVAIKSGIIGLVIAYSLFGWVTFSWDRKLIKSIFWVIDVEFKINLLIGAIGLLTMAYIFGQMAGVDILMKRKNDYITGIKYGLLTLLLGTIIGSTVGFMQEGIFSDGLTNPFFDYYFKPLYWVTIFGTLPAILVGLWFGRKITKLGLKKVN